MLPYLECQLIQGNLNLALDVINDTSKHFRAILPDLSLRQMLLNDRKRQLVVKFLPYKEVLDLGEFCLLCVEILMCGMRKTSKHTKF